MRFMKDKREDYEGKDWGLWRMRGKFLKDKREIYKKEVYERYGRKFMKDKREVYEG